MRSIFLLFVSPCCPRGCDDVCVSLSMVVFLPWLSVWRSLGVSFSSFFFFLRQDGSFFAALWSSAGMSDACSGGLTLFGVDFLQG